MSDEFKILDVSDMECQYIDGLLKKYIMGIVISTDTGNVLYHLQIDKSLKIDLYTQFIAALAMFGEEIGKIRRILIEGINIQITIKKKQNLIITSFFRPNVVQDYLAEEAEIILDVFHTQYKTLIDKDRSNQDLYNAFDNKICGIIYDYMVRIKAINEEPSSCGID